MIGILKYNETLRIKFDITDEWVCVADGVAVDIPIVLRIGQSNILLSYTPDTVTPPDDTYIQNVYMAGNIFITTENQAVWIRVPNFNFPATLIGEIVEPEPILQPSTVPVTIMGLPWRLG